MEQKFDSFFKDFSVVADPKLETFKEPISKVEEDKFTRSDLVTPQDPSQEKNFSVFPDKGSERGGRTETVETQVPNISSNWKRIDIRQKKVIRTLCDLAKDYFKSLVTKATTTDEIFETWNNVLSQHFPELYTKTRLMLLGQISVTCYGWKYTQKFKS